MSFGCQPLGVYRGRGFHSTEPSMLRLGVQKKTGRPVQFEITEQTRAAIQAWLADIRSRSTRYLFASRGPSAAAPVDPAVCPDRPFLGRERWAR